VSRLNRTVGLDVVLLRWLYDCWYWNLRYLFVIGIWSTALRSVHSTWTELNWTVLDRSSRTGDQFSSDHVVWTSLCSLPERSIARGRSHIRCAALINACIFTSAAKQRAVQHTCERPIRECSRQEVEKSFLFGSWHLTFYYAECFCATIYYYRHQ